MLKPNAKAAVRENDLTDARFWDARWETAGRSERPLSPFHGVHGRNGYIMRMVRRYISDLKGMSVLEVGGGGGAHRLLALAKWGRARASTIDYSAVGLRQTEATFKSNGCEIDTYLADLFEWDGAGRQFDLVVHWGVIEHFQDPAAVLKRTAELLKPNGTTLFSMPNMEAWGAKSWKKWAPNNWSYHIHHSQNRIREATESAGLRLVNSFNYGPPLLKICPWETQGLVQSVMTVAHYGATAASWLLPVYSRGLPQVSQERGFFARKVS